MPRGRPGSSPKNPHDVEGLQRLSPGPRKRCAIYARISPEQEKDDAISRTDQIETCKSYAIERGWVVVGVYWDLRSGVRKDRAAYQRLLADGYEGNYDVLLVWRDDRLFRGLSGLFPVWELLEERRDIELVGVSRPIERKLLGMYAQFSELERENIRDRTVSARQRRARQGVLPGSAYPYWLMRGEDDKPLLDPERTPAILWAIEQYMREGMRTRDILRYLRENFPPYRRAIGVPHKWSTAALMRSFRHPAIWGEYYYSRVGEPSDGLPLPRLRMHQKAESPERSILVNVPPLVHRNEDALATCLSRGGCEMDSRPTGTALAARLEQRRWDSPRNTKHEYPLRRKVVCGVCDTVLVARAPQSYWKVLKDGTKVKHAWKTPPIRLRCTGHQRREKGQRCRVKDDVNGRHVWTSVKATLRNYMQQPDLGGRVWTAFANGPAEGFPTGPHTAEHLVGELERIKERVARLLADTDESLDDVRRATEQLRMRRLAVELELTALTSQKHEAMTRFQAAEQGRQALAQVWHLNLDDIDEHEWSHFAKLLIDRITIDRDNAMTMRLNFELGEIPVPWVVGLYAAA